MNKALALRISERELQETVLEVAAIFGWLAYHTHDSRRSQPGFPDLVLVRPPRLLFAELKTERGRMTEAQTRWRDQLLATGAEWHLWRPSDLDAITAMLGSAPTGRNQWIGTTNPPSDVT